MADFADWLTGRYHQMADTYRQSLLWITRTVATHVEGSAGLNEGQAAAMIELLREVPRPELGKYPGEASDQDKQYYLTAKRPDWQSMLGEAEAKITALCHTSATKK